MEHSPAAAAPAPRGYKLHEFVAHSSDVRCLAIGKKSSKVFITGGDDRKVNLWAIGKTTPLLSLSGHTNSVESVAFDSAEVLLLAGASNGSVKLWDLEEAKAVRTLTGHRSNCSSVEFHPFGEIFASGSSDNDLKLWDIKKKGCIHTYKGHSGAIKSIRFSPDGRWVVTGGEDNLVKLWDLTAGKLLNDFKAHSGNITCINFHPQELLLATGSADQTVKFWDLETFELIGSTGSEPSGVHSMVFHPDGRNLFCGSDMLLKAYSWEPVICHDSVEIGWNSLADLNIYEGKVLGCSYHECRVGVWVSDISLIRPYAIGVLPKANYLVDSSHDTKEYVTSKPSEITTQDSACKIKEATKTEVAPVPSVAFDRPPLVPTSSDELCRKDMPSANSSVSRKNDPKSPFKPSSHNSSTRVIRRAENSAVRNSEVHTYQAKGGSLNSSPAFVSPAIQRKRIGTRQAYAKDITAVNPTIAAPVLLPRDIPEDKACNVERETISHIDAASVSYCSPTHLQKASDDNSDYNESHLIFQFERISPFSDTKPKLHSGDVLCHNEVDHSKMDVETKPGLPKFNNVELLQCPAESDEDKCSVSPRLETEKVKYVRGVAVPLGKTKSLVESWERRDMPRNNSAHHAQPCSEVRSYSPSPSPLTTDESFEKVLTTVNEDATPNILIQEHDVFINTMKSRLTKLEALLHVLRQSGIKGTITALAKLPDPSVQADLVSSMKEKLEHFNLETFVCLLPILSGLLNGKIERHSTISLEMLLDLVKIFGPIIRSTMSRISSVGVDVQAEQRLQRCTRCFNHLQKIRQMLPVLMKRSTSLETLAQELDLSLQDLAVT